jgi:prophage regulatory protein
VNAITIRQVASKVALGRSTIYRLIAEGKFPKPFQLVPNRNAWIESDIDAWLAEKAGKVLKVERCGADVDASDA